jgi:SAM-dependent methyltransferase
MTAEFDRYAADGYSQLLNDPIRRNFAPRPEFFHERKLALLRNFCQRRGLQTENLHWLDVGCGEGDLLRAGKPYFQRIAGCDVSAGMIGHSEGFDARLQESLERIPFASASFDLVTAVCVYHHVGLAHRQGLTTDILRVLKPKGIFCIIEHNPFNPIAQLIVRRCPLDLHARLLTPMTAKRLVKEAGMKVLETEYFLYLPERLYRILSRTEEVMSRLPFGGQYAIMCQEG